jgi:hypothetical protein
LRALNWSSRAKSASSVPQVVAIGDEPKMLRQHLKCHILIPQFHFDDVFLSSSWL